MSDVPGIARRPLLQGCLAAGVGVLGLGALSACGGPQTTPTTPAPGPLATLDQVPVGRTTVVTSPNGAPVALVRTEAGVVAHSAICTHQGCAVTEVADGGIVCACHGSVFSASDGSPQAGPATTALAERNITVRDGAVVVA